MTRSTLRIAFLPLVLFGAVEACSADDDAPPPLGASPEGGAPDGSSTPAGDGGDAPDARDAQPAEPTSILSFAEANAIRALSAGVVEDDVVVAGADNFEDDAGNRNAVAFRSDLAGRVRWAKRVGGDFNDQLLTHVVVGATMHGFGITRTVFTGAARNTDVLWASVDVATGAVNALRHFGTTANEDALGSVAVADGVVVVGVSGTDAYVAKVADGAVVWARTWSTPGTDSFRWVGVAGDELVAVGFSTLVAEGGKTEPIVAVFDRNGGHVRSRRITGAAQDVSVFSARVVGGDVVLAGQTRPAAGAPTVPFAARVPFGDGPLAWARTYTTPETTGNATFRATALAGADDAFDLPETLAVGGSAGGRAFLARLATSDGQPLARVLLRAPAEATIALDREVLWERKDRGFGTFFQMTPKGSEVSASGLALTNRLFGLAPACTWASEPALTLAEPPGLAAADLAPAVVPATFTVAATGPALVTTDLALTQDVGCAP
ncbi:MAG: hypothetical protein KIT84_40090 [Labilithrix sp.]|nr:hypothetical protein [Labilithrix sp.]MCW5817267.1 hypothetical protein [Labilithrix sp.]